MIPHRTLSRENSGNAVKCRIAACRKRLRTIRVTLKASNHIQMDEECREAVVSAAGRIVDSHGFALDRKETAFVPAVVEGQKAKVT
jgi:hypothetical protein